MNNRIAPETQLITKRLSLRSKISPTNAIPNIIRAADTWIEKPGIPRFPADCRQFRGRMS
jgi:hypothetical protein